MGKNNHEEEITQRAIAQYFRVNGYLTIDCDALQGLKFIPSKNTIQRITYIKSHNLKGYTPGQPDLIVLLENKTLLIECKSSTGKQSDEQKEFQKQSIKLNHEYVLMNKTDDAIQWLENHKKQMKIQAKQM